jgi:hypothetical protein
MSKAVQQLPQVILPTFDGAIADAARQKLDAARLEVIRNDADYEAYALRMKDAKARGKILESGYEQHAAPLNAALKSVRGFWKPAIDIVEQECGLRARAMGEYHNKKQAEQRRLQQLADEEAAKQRRALEARAQKADGKGDVDKAIALSQQAAMTVAPVVRTDAPKITGQSVREVWLFQIEDASRIPREYLMPDEAKLGRFAKAMKADAVVAGVRFYSETRVASGA